MKHYDHTKDIYEKGNEYRWVCPFCPPAFVEMSALPYSLDFLKAGVVRHVQRNECRIGWHEWA